MAKSTIDYDKKQCGFAASVSENNIWNFELERGSRKGIRISYWIAGVKPGRSGGVVLLSRESFDGKEAESEVISNWSSKDDKWKVLDLVDKDDLQKQKLSAFQKRTITIKDAKAGAYRLNFHFNGGKSAAAIKKVEIKKL